MNIDYRSNRPFASMSIVWQTAIVLRAASENNSLKIFVNHFFASLEKESCILPSCSVQWIVKTCAQRGRQS